MSNPPRPPQQPPVPKPPDPKVGTTAWISCRAKAGCQGKQAVYQMAFTLASGGRSIRYRCSTCGGVFHLTY